MKQSSDKIKYDLAEAMRECMKHTPVESITIKQVCEQAHCSRQTFYRGFQDKYDLINWYFDRILLESFDRMGHGHTIYDGLVRKFQYIKEERLFFEAGFRMDTQNDLRTHDFEMIFAFYVDLITIKKNYPLSKAEMDILEMYCYASVYMTVKWVLSGMHETPEQLAKTMIQAMPSDLSNIFKKLMILA